MEKEKNSYFSTHDMSNHDMTYHESICHDSIHITNHDMSEVSENIVYTYDGEHLKLNGRSAYEGKVNKL